MYCTPHDRNGSMAANLDYANFATGILIFYCKHVGQSTCLSAASHESSTRKS
jgi:hypothetical protein